MRESVNLISGFKRILFTLLTNTRSHQAALIIFLGIGLADLLFRFLLFPVYTELLFSIGAKPVWNEIDASFAPIVWLVFFTIILGSLTIVITFASQNVPKLIDLYMDHWPSLLFVWWSTACFVHSLTIKLFAEAGVNIVPSLIFNFHFLLSVSLVIGFPFILSILKSTKTSNVIENLLAGSYQSFNDLANRGSTATISEKEHAKIQQKLFEELNQLMDLLVYVPYKEPKAHVIEGIGKLIQHYIKLKHKIPESLFKINQLIEEDISFRTMKSLMKEIEKSKTFYEQKSFRLISTAYNIFLESGEFDLSSLCAEQLSQVGKIAIECDDQELIEVITIRLNTYFRFALKHAQNFNEPRNLYNLVFHYGQFLGYLTESNQVDRVKNCIGHFVFYGQNCFNAIASAPSLSFILDVIAFEIQKLLINVFNKNWDREIQKDLLLKFLMFDNFQDIDRDFARNFFSNNYGIRLLHIGLALFYLEQKEDEFTKMIAIDTMQDFKLFGESLFVKTMKTIFTRLEISGPKFWEDTDRGNLNIYYTPFKNQIKPFILIQEKLKLITEKTISA